MTYRNAAADLNSRRFTIGGFPFNDNAIFFCLVALVAIGWAIFGKRVATSSPESEPTPQKFEGKVDETKTKAKTEGPGAFKFIF